MTARSIILGVLSSVFMCLFCYINDKGIRSGTMIQHMLPSVAYGGMALFVLVFNPILKLCHKKIALNKGEVAAVLFFVLVTCGIPGWNLGNMFPGACMFPHHDNRTIPAWSSHKVLELAHPNALCDVSGPKGEEIALNGFVSGLGRGDEFINVSDVPWSAWTRPFVFWGPVIVSFLVAVFGLAVVFHRQWSSHEQLPYPIIQFATALLPSEDGRMSPIFKNKLFIIGFSVAFLILFNNYLVRCFPQFFIPIRLSFNMAPFRQLAHTVVMGKGAQLFYPQLLFTVVSLAYFLPSEASFTMWIGPWIYCFIAGVFASYGVNLRGGKMMELVPELFIFSGGFFGLFLIILYTGRHFYWNTLKRSLFLKSNDDIPDYSVFGMRVFLVGIAVFIILLQNMGIHWTIAIPYTILSLMVYVCISRVLAETGAFEVGSYVYPCVFLWGVVGVSALGPKVLLMMFLLSTMLLATPGWSTMPFLNQGFKLIQNANVSLKKSAHWGLCTTVLAIFIAIPATIYWQYNIGAHPADWSRISAKYPFATVLEVVQTLKAQGLEDVALSRSGFDHILNINPDWDCVGIFVLSALIVIGIAIGRLKFSWWPFHPIICIFYGGHQAMKMSFAFGLGCLLKYMITKYGGGKTYQACKPIFIGLIAGTLTEELVQMLIGAVYYFATGSVL